VRWQKRLWRGRIYRPAGISFSHFLNDTMQSLIPSVYPILKEAMP